ncbi:scaffolding protein [Gordonia phage Guacamole]|uniref:head scaffolding protein n=1 Tax=Gordonia phage Guacamole TaxID=1821553 RepID=UPI00078C939D|nr:head scaffolding protein [Gordonia phage Guacamole]AMS03496.1 scaffolding protein [Gordonia phage Guacamole]QDB74509.1 scaffolding protein [Gordonia phage Melba]QDH85326.1 scaffolding protein [Gordonia phage MintFen]QDM56742.1 scaffolding protein [Gordonia phage JasperJr]
MPGIVQVTQRGPKTFTPADNQVIKGGQLVEARTGGRIGVAAAGSLKVLGVALTDAVAPEDFPGANGTDAIGRPVVSLAPIPTTVAVAYAGTEVKVTYAADATFGDKLIAAANGQVTPAGATPDARTIVGICTEPAGVDVSEKAVGLIRLA